MTTTSTETHEAHDDPSGLAIRCSCGNWSMLYRNSLGKTAEHGFRHHVAKQLARSQVARDVADFHQLIDSPPWLGSLLDMPLKTVVVRNKLLHDECVEAIEATERGDVVAIAQELADLVYVAYGTAYTYGIDLDAALEAVHRSNMTKEPGPDGGKAIKGEGYEVPDLTASVANAATHEPSDWYCCEQCERAGSLS